MPAKTRQEKESPASNELTSLGALPGERVVRVSIRGLDPGILMHNPSSMQAKQGTKPRCCSHDLTLDEKCVKCLEAATYRDSTGGLCIPSVAMHGCLINASGQFKMGKKSSVPLISGVLRVRPLEIPITVEGAPFQTDAGELDYKIDTRFVVINRQRVIGHRPWIPAWTATMNLIYDPVYLVDENVLREIVVSAGRRVGVLDFRPQHRGPFGTFVVEEWTKVGPT